MNIKQYPITIGSTVGIIGLLFGVWFFMDDYFAHADEVRAGQKQTISAINDLRVQIITAELNRIEAKIQYKRATEYDLLRKKQLEREWQQLTK